MGMPLPIFALKFETPIWRHVDLADAPAWRDLCE
jgi:hypothetical protein